MYQRAMTFRLDGVGWFHVVIGEARWDVYEVDGVALSLSECTSGVQLSRRVGHGAYHAYGGPRLEEGYCREGGDVEGEALRALSWAFTLHRAHFEVKT